MKKHLVFILIFSLILMSLTACKDDEPEIDEEEVQKTLDLFEDEELVDGFKEFKNMVATTESKRNQERIIDEFFKVTAEKDFPLQDKEQVIFVYRAEDEIEEVEFAADFTMWERAEMDNLADTSFYYKIIKLAPDTTFDYAFWVDDQLSIDSLNQNTSASTYFKELSNYQMKEHHSVGRWEADDNLAGELLADNSFKVYLPKDYDSQKEHSLTYFVGPDYLEAGNLANTLDLLAEEEGVTDNIAVFVEDIVLKNGNLSFALAEIKEKLTEQYNISTVAKDHYLIGYGEYAAELINVAFNHQDKYLNLLLQSPNLTELPKLPEVDDGLNIYLSWGEYGPSINSSLNLDFLRLLKDNGYNYQAQIHPMGNQWSNWREDVWPGLNYLFTGKIDQQQELVIADDFTSQYSPYFRNGSREDFTASREAGSYKLEFNETRSLKLDNYQFRDFELDIRFNDLTGGFALLLLGDNDYTVLKNTEEKKIYLSSLEKDIFEEVSFSTDFKLDRLQIVSQAEEIKFLINGITVDSLTIEQSSSKKIGFLGTNETTVEINKIEIRERLN